MKMLVLTVAELDAVVFELVSSNVTPQEHIYMPPCKSWPGKGEPLLLACL